MSGGNHQNNPFAQQGNPFAAAMEAMQSLAKGGMGQVPFQMPPFPGLNATASMPPMPQFPGMGAMPSFPGMPSMPHMPSIAPMSAPEAGWWWLPKVGPDALRAAATKWFSPTTDVSEIAAKDRRFRSPSWQSKAYFLELRNQYLRTAAFWRELVASADLEERERHRAKFFLEQMLDAAAPSNCFLTNPEAIEKALETHGESLKHGLENLKARRRSGSHRDDR